MKMKYEIIEGYLNPYGSEVENIEKKVSKKLEAGFKLYGQLIHLKDNKYSQAMVKVI